MPVDVAAYVFEGKDAAEDALREAREVERAGLAWIEDVAVIKRHKSGRVSVNSTWAQDTSEVGAHSGFGALTGVLIGALAGPGGALAGLFAGGTTGLLIGGVTAEAVADPVLDDLADSLAKDTSALVLWGDVNPFVKEFENFNGKLIQTAIADDVAQRIRDKALRS